MTDGLENRFHRDPKLSGPHNAKVTSSSRQCSRMTDHDEGGDQMESGEESLAQLVVAGGNAAEMFELVEKAFHAVALIIEHFVVEEFFAPRVDGRDDGFQSVPGQALADAVGIIAFVQRRRLQ